MSKAPIKTCEYCGAIGKMPTFIDGETTCMKCLSALPTDLREAKHLIVKLRKQIVDKQAIDEESRHF